MKNLRADAEAGRVYYIAECMGRKAGWLSYGVGIAGRGEHDLLGRGRRRGDDLRG